MIHRGRIAKRRQIVAVRELVRDDLALLREPRALKTVARFRDPHHRLARMIATGIRQKDVVARSGYSLARVTSIMSDPAFMDLVAKYRNDVLEHFKENADDMLEIATSNMLKAERMLSEKFDEADENGELLPTKDLIAIRLQRAISRSGKAVQIEAKAVTSVPPSPPRAGVESPSAPAHLFRRRA